MWRRRGSVSSTDLHASESPTLHLFFMRTGLQESEGEIV
jgi:hypothetical protein